MDPVLLRVTAVSAATRTLEFSVRTHVPRPVKIMYSTDLAPSSWTVLVPQSLNPDEWTTVTYTHPSALPERWFFRAVAE